VPQVSLIALDAEHASALQQVYELTPSFWDLYGLVTAPAGQGERDLKAILEERGRYGMGILLPNEPGNTEAGAQLVGLLDFRLHWPEEGIIYLGMIMVAEPRQRQGIGREAWEILEPWLANEAHMHTARLGVEQFNPGAMQFFEKLGFELTGDSQRVRSGQRFVRLLYMEKKLKRNA
jgi:RimJ/RimL family protein N-acetyltransferase